MYKKYVPGVCNIGEADVRRRKAIGWTWLLATIVLFAVFRLPQTPASWHLILIRPAAISSAGFLQARMHFCAYFAALGIFNFGEDFSKKETVQQAEFRAKDRRKALQIIAYSLIIGIAVSATSFFLALAL
jgi:hypothetical protein